MTNTKAEIARVEKALAETKSPQMPSVKLYGNEILADEHNTF